MVLVLVICVHQQGKAAACHIILIHVHPADCILVFNSRWINKVLADGFTPRLSN